MKPQTINIGKFPLKIQLEEQTSPLGRPLRLSAITKINYNQYAYTFKFLDVSDDFVTFLFDNNGQYLSKIDLITYIKHNL